MWHARAGMPYGFAVSSEVTLALAVTVVARSQPLQSDQRLALASGLLRPCATDRAPLIMLLLAT